MMLTYGKFCSVKRIILVFLALASGAAGGDSNPMRLSLRGNRTVWAIRTPSGSMSGWRMYLLIRIHCASAGRFRSKIPVSACLFHCIGFNGAILNDSRLWCKTVDPLTTDGFRRIMPEEVLSLFPDGFAIGPFLQGHTGDFSLVCIYSTKASREAEWFGLYTDEYWKNRNRNSFWKSRKSEIAKVQKLLRKVLRVTLVSDTLNIRVGKASGITRDRAMNIARVVCEEQGWDWEGVHAEELAAEWRITTGFGRLGGNAFIRMKRQPAACSTNTSQAVKSGKGES